VRYLAPAVLAILVAAIVAVALNVVGGSTPSSGGAASARAAARRVPPYWIVRSGNTFTQIAHRTGLTIAQLEAFNPRADPSSLVPGQRLNLWAHPPRPRPKPAGPMFWTVRPGESFGSIAARTRINIVKLEELNPRLKASTLQPGERIKLRS
jgi:LysM repeat protein